MPFTRHRELGRKWPVSEPNLKMRSRIAKMFPPRISNALIRSGLPDNCKTLKDMAQVPMETIAEIYNIGNGSAKRVFADLEPWRKKQNAD